MKRPVRRCGRALVALTATVTGVAAPVALGTLPQLGTVRAGAASATAPVPASTKVSLTFESYILSEGAGPSAALGQLISQFEARHPNIHVTAQPPSGGVTSAVASVQKEAAVGQTPDVAQETFDGLNFLVHGLDAVNLTKAVGRAGIDATLGGADPMIPAVRTLGNLDGSTYGIPWTLSTPMVFYNADLFDRAGLDPSTPPTTWAQVLTDAEKIKSATGADGLSNGCAGTQASGYDWCLQAILDSNGGGTANASGTKVTFDSSANVAALEEMQALSRAGVMPNLTETQSITEFAQGKLAMILNSSALMAVLLNSAADHFTVDAAKLPAFGAKASVPTNSGSALFIFSKDRTKQRAAWELVQYLTSPAAETVITKQIGYPPLRPALLTDAAYLGSWAHSATLLAPNMAQLQHIKPWLSYSGASYLQVETLLMNAVSNIIWQGANPKSALSQAQSQAKGLLGS